MYGKRIVCILFITCQVVVPIKATEPSKPPSKIDSDAAANSSIRQATAADRLEVAEGFRVELLYSVSKEQFGSWISLCLDNRNRILVSDQYGGIYRFPAPALEQILDPSTIEPVPAPIRAVNGMIWAFGSLYAAVTDIEEKIKCGLYRLTDSDCDDMLDHSQLLRPMENGREHGVHSIVLSPNKSSLFLVAGNRMPITDYRHSRVPPIWGEDHLLPAMPDLKGATQDTLAPGGVIYKITPDGSKFEIFAAGFRNCFDLAFNGDGELFTCDSDMEYDFNTPWYRPTRLCHVISGSDFGWRRGSSKWPDWYPDSLPPVLNMGAGSPTGMIFGYGAKFPSRYQQALFVLDWTGGRIRAIRLSPHGASYSAIPEDFLTGAPLPLTDVIVHPEDGAMYFTTGGRKVQSGLYRVTYVGNQPTDPISLAPRLNQFHQERRRLEDNHAVPKSGTVDQAWQTLGHPDRFLRWAARTAIEHRPADLWMEQVFEERDPAMQLEALLALTRATGTDPLHRTTPALPDQSIQRRILNALTKLNWDGLTAEQKIKLIRTYQVCLNRFGRPGPKWEQKILNQIEERFPDASAELNAILCETLVFLESPSVATKAVRLMKAATTQEEQLEYARSLRLLRSGWKLQARKDYFRWLSNAATYPGGLGFSKFIELIRQEATENLTPADSANLGDLVNPPRTESILSPQQSQLLANRTPRKWTVEQLAAAAEKSLVGRDYDNGRTMFAVAMCFSCHRFNNEGGMMGPDLTMAGNRYSPSDFFEQIIDPSKEINDQFSSLVITTNDGLIRTGSIVDLKQATITLNTNPANPSEQTVIDTATIESLKKSAVSSMPTGLLDLLREHEILDLTAYVLSGGDPEHEYFRSPETRGGSIPTSH